MSADPFISREDLSDFIGSDVTSSDKALIAVDSACDIVRTITGQVLSEVLGGTAILDGTGTDVLQLPERPVLNAGTVIESGGTLTLDTDYKLGANDTLYRLPGVIDNGWGSPQPRCYWWPGRQNITVTYSHGYPDDDFPRDVRMVALSIAARLYGGNVSGVTYEQLGEYRVGYGSNGSDVTKTEDNILQHYRRGK